MRPEGHHASRPVPRSHDSDFAADELPDAATAFAEAGDLDESARLTRSLQQESEELWKQHRLAALLTLTLPVWQTPLVLTAAWLWGGFSLVQRLVAAALASVVAGRFLILAGEADQPKGFTSTEFALILFYLDSIWAIVLTWHAGLLLHLPWAGPHLKAAVHEGSLLVRRNRWMRNLTFGAVLCFVMLPVSSTGSIGGSLLGRLLGLSRGTTLTVVLLGSCLGCAMMYLGAELLEPFRGSNPLARYGAVAVLVVIGLILTRRYRRALNR